MAHKNSYENEELHHLYEIIDRGKDDDIFLRIDYFIVFNIKSQIRKPD
jgi:hypothetical protein